TGTIITPLCLMDPTSPTGNSSQSAGISQSTLNEWINENQYNIDAWIDNLSEFAQSEGMYYFSCRGDTAWKKLRNSDLACRLVSVDLELALPILNPQLKKCRQCSINLGADVTGNRKFACDSLYSFSAENIEISSNSNNGLNRDDKSSQTVSDAEFVIKDLATRGGIVIAEMQQIHNKIAWKDLPEDPDEDTYQVDDMPHRLELYANMATIADSGKTENEEDLRYDKNPGDETARSVISTAYCCYDSFGKHSTGISVPTRPFTEGASTRGTVITKVNLGKKRTKENFFKEKLSSGFYDPNAFSEQIVEKGMGAMLREDQGFRDMYTFMLEDEIGQCKEAMEGFSDIAKETLIIYAMSDLLIPDVVKNFSESAKEVCKLLEVNMENVKAGTSPDEIKAMVDGFSAVKAARERAKSAEARAKAAETQLQKLASLPPETQQILIAAGVDIPKPLDERSASSSGGASNASSDHEVSSETTTTGSNKGETI
ncbi:MAG: hypothetical protein K2L13_00690, partial [Opitutales bacterium]|nr:hypothetical protein [Opitutales bacterium]